MLLKYIFLFLLILHVTLFGADGDLDSSFANGGKLLTNVVITPSSARDVAIDGSGKIVLAGRCKGLGSIRFSLVRLNDNGSLDTTFNHVGKICNSEGRLNALKIDSNGKIIVAGEYSDNFKLVRYESNGSIDKTFNGYGEVETDLGGLDEAYDIAVHGSKIYVVGRSDGNFSIASYDSNGSLDTTFNSTGKVITDFGSDGDTAQSVVVDADGKIVVAGYTSNAQGIHDFAIARYNTDGTLDTSFSGDGKLTVDVNGEEDIATDVTIDGSGKIVVVGRSANGANHDDFSILRLNSSGTLDTSFNSTGKVFTDFGNHDDIANAIAVDGSKIIVTGYASNGGTLNNFALARYNNNGSLDTSFSGDGKLTTNFVADSMAYAVAISSTKIVAAGENNSSFTVARYIDNGALDTNFDSDGKVHVRVVGSDDSLNDLAIDSNGKILAVGDSEDDLALLRYNSDGSLDTTFGIGGKSITDLNGKTDFGTSVVILNDNSIVVGGGGHELNHADMDFAIVHYTKDGILDGSLLTDINNHSDTIRDMALQSDGKLVAAGISTNANGDDDFALVRYTNSGGLDNSFGTASKVVTDFSSGYDDSLRSMVIDSNDAIIVAGTTYNSTGGASFALAKYTKDGQLDTSFNGDGKVKTSFGARAYASSVKIDKNKKILVAGSTETEIALAKYNSDGSLDTSFSGDGKLLISLAGVAYLLVSDLEIETNGKMLISCVNEDDLNNFILIRLNQDGTLDNTFSDDGVVQITFDNSIDYCYPSSITLDKRGRILVGGYAESYGGNSFFALTRYQNKKVNIVPIVSYILGF